MVLFPTAWKSHIASIIIYRCVGQALAQSFDPRGSLREFNWDVLTDGLLTPDDLKMIWFFIEREVSLTTISEHGLKIQFWTAVQATEICSVESITTLSLPRCPPHPPHVVSVLHTFTQNNCNY